jgi:hypothetical protein
MYRMDKSASAILLNKLPYMEVVPVHAMKAYRGVLVYLHSFLNSALDGR